MRENVDEVEKRKRKRKRERGEKVIKVWVKIFIIEMWLFFIEISKW